MCRLGIDAEILDMPAQAVPYHPARAIGPLQLALEGEFDPFLADLLDVGEADHVRCRRAFRVTPTVLGPVEDAGDAHRLDTCPHVGVDLSPEPCEFTIACGALGELGHGHAQRGGQRLALRRVGGKGLR